MQNLSLYLMAGLYIVAGVLHFVSPRTYLAIMPPYIPYPWLMVIVSGFFEVLFGVGLLFPQTRSLSAWGLILLLIAVFPANLYMATSGRFHNIPQWLLWARLPLQGVLIWWASRFI
ncbi:DoxX family protein [Nibrella saemangeumensis]|uniref:DoxX family protein n=1 Tax=Nibrella saemangeumensis TaxID=1084526 RepID=A0ABP8NJ24_9BACT